MILPGTMKRHRVAANRVRSQQGLSLLPKGRFYSVFASHIHHVPQIPATGVQQAEVELHNQHIPDTSFSDPLQSNDQHTAPMDVQDSERENSTNIGGH